MNRICRHDGWGFYPDETGPCPDPAEMVGPCEHNIECPACKFRISVSPCGHEVTTASPVVYRVATAPPTETRR